MKTQITRYLGSLVLATSLFASTTAAFAATPDLASPALYDDENAVQEGEFTAEGLEYGGAALGVGSAVVGAAAGDTEAGQDTGGSLGVASEVVGGAVPAIVRIGTR